MNRSQLTIVLAKGDAPVHRAPRASGLRALPRALTRARPLMPPRSPERLRKLQSLDYSLRQTGEEAETGRCWASGLQAQAWAELFGTVGAGQEHVTGGGAGGRDPDFPFLSARPRPSSLVLQVLQF